MAVKIRLKRMGKIRAPYYRVVVADSRTRRDGRAIEEIGKYHPTEEPSLVAIDSERVQYWLGVGAQPSEQVLALLKVTGDWQKFKGLPGAEGTLRTAEPRPDRHAAYEAAMREVQGEPTAEATTQRRSKPAKAAAAPAATDASTDAPTADASTAEAPAAEAATVEAATAEPAGESPAAAEAETAATEPA